MKRGSEWCSAVVESRCRIIEMLNVRSVVRIGCLLLRKKARYRPVSEKPTETSAMGQCVRTHLVCFARVACPDVAHQVSKLCGGYYIKTPHQFSINIITDGLL